MVLVAVEGDVDASEASIFTCGRGPREKATRGQHISDKAATPAKSDQGIKSELRNSPVFRVDGSEDNGRSAVSELFCGIGERDDLWRCQL